MIVKFYRAFSFYNKSFNLSPMVHRCTMKKAQIQDILTFYFISIEKYKLLYLGYFSLHIDLLKLKLKLLL